LEPCHRFDYYIIDQHILVFSPARVKQYLEFGLPLVEGGNPAFPRQFRPLLLICGGPSFVSKHFFAGTCIVVSLPKM